MAQVKLLAMSALVTVLVWMSADQLLTESATVQVIVDPVATAGESYTVSLRDPTAGGFQVVLSGPREVIARFRESGPWTIRLPIEARTTGPIGVPVLDALRKNRTRFSGLTVDSVVPEYLEAVVDRDIVVSLPVWVDKGALDYDVDPTVEPDHVQVTISEQRFNAVPPEKRRLVLRAESMLRNRKKGELLSFPVPLEAKVDGVDVKVVPARVNLRATVRELRITDTIAAVPVRFSSSVDLANEFRIELRNRSTLLTQPITVRGPAELVDRLVAGDIRVTGLIALNRDDTLDPGRYRAKRPVFVGLPPGVELANPEAVESVEFRLTRFELGPP